MTIISFNKARQFGLTAALATLVAATGARAQQANIPPDLATNMDPTSLPYSETSTYPRLLMTPAKADAYLTSTNPNVHYVMLRLYVSGVKAILANEAATPGYYTTPTTGFNIQQYYPDSGTLGVTLTDAPAFNTLALFLYLVDRGAATGNYYTYQNGDSAATFNANVAAARALATKILLNWTTGGYQDANGVLLTDDSQITSADGGSGSVSENLARDNAQMLIGRGLTPFALGYDMLRGDPQTTLTTAQIAGLDQFFQRMLTFEVSAVNAHHTFVPHTGVQEDDEAEYENQTGQGVKTEAMLAALTGNTDVLEGLAGHASVTTMNLSIPQYIEGAIYGYNDVAKGQPSDFKATYPSPITNDSAGLYQTTTPAAGEIVDRYRLAHGMGYTASVIESLVESALVMNNQGYDIASFQGTKGQSIKLALDYYAQYSTKYLTYAADTLPATDSTILDYGQYGTEAFSVGGGASVAGGDAAVGPFSIGTQLYPTDSAIYGVLDAAQAAATAHSSTTIAYSVMDAEGWSTWMPPLAAGVSH